jgi:uncharacterized membrane protein
VTATIAIAALWFAFGATHLILSSLTLRPRLIEKVGAQPFQGLYSLLALVIFVPLVWIYFENQHAGPLLWYGGQNPVLRYGMYAGMGVALALLVGGFVTPSPAMQAKPSAEPPVRGVLRVTRHPVVMGMGLFGLVHLFAAQVHTSELAFFGGFPIWAVIGCRHQDQRKLANLGEPYRVFCSQTAFLPFARGGFVAAVGESAVPIGIAVGLAVLLRVFHQSWFGGA